MRSYISCRLLLSFIAVSELFVCCARAEDYRQAQAVIGVETVASGGRYTISEVSQIAKKNGVDIIVTADAFINRWRYGLWPLRAIIRKTEQTRSLRTYGIRRYFNDIRLAQKEFTDMVIIGGAEAAPFYRWEGSLLRKNFAIKDWHKHMVIIGLKDPDDYMNLPVIENGTSLARPFGYRNILYMLLPLLLLTVGLFCLFQGRYARPDIYERRYGLLLMHWRYCGIFLTAAGLLAAVNNYPFRDFIYDQYHGDRGALPYQNMIDYVNKRGGMTFWAHPEAKNMDKIAEVSIETGEHAGLLIDTRDYTGFAVFYEGYDILGKPQGVWDKLLMDYCRGVRRTPVWAIGMTDYERSGDLGEWMRNLRTVLFVRDLTDKEALKALGEGRMYVSKDANAGIFSLDSFTVGDPAGHTEITMGQEIALAGTIRVRIKGHFTKAPIDGGPVKILLIRDGEPISAFDAEAPFDIIYDDVNAGKSGKHYYRAEIRSRGLLLVTNPIFIRLKQPSSGKPASDFM